ncbi:NUDIX hydrolase [Porticoccaceae bacterium]|nr:NUDIX hydrolase [Porticoccaceae bacterium]
MKNSKLVLDSKWMRVRKEEILLPDGTIVEDYFLWEQGDIVIVVPMTVDGLFLLVEQYRHGAGKFLVEFPGGMQESSETAFSAAHRELLEETGYVVDQLILLGTFHDSPTKAEGVTRVYLGSNAVYRQATNFDVTEDIESMLVSSNTLKECINSGKIQVSGSIAAAHLALQFLGL